MFGIGWSELAVILCVAIIFIHPKDLPALFRKLGRLYSKVKKIYTEIVATKDQFVKDIEEAAALEETNDAQAKVDTTSPAGKAAGAASTAAPEAVATAVPASAMPPAGDQAATPETPLAADADAKPHDASITEPCESSPYTNTHEKA